MLCTAFEELDMHRFRIFFETTPYCHAYANYILQNLHLYTQTSVYATNTRPFGEVGGNPPLQISSRTHFAKIEDKKVIAKN